MDPPKFYQPGAETRVGHNRMPHWSQREATYFVTWRLADSIPGEKMKRLKEERELWSAAQVPKPWPLELELQYHRRFSAKVEKWLDLGSGSCLLRDPDIAAIGADALAFFEGQRSVMHAWVVMPNHVHALFGTLGDATPATLIHSWKGHTARAINERVGRVGTLWQKSYFDRLVRDWEHFGRCVRYVRDNPGKANLAKEEWRGGVSELAGRFL